MLTESIGLQPPKSAQEFEDFCHIVYMKVLDDPLATKYGRSGQKQDGVDVFATRKAERYGIQCKQKTFGRLTQKIIDEEVKAADEGDVRIHKLVIATTAANDVKLVAYAAKLTDQRSAAGKFEVHLAFWDTLETHVRSNPELQFLFSPQMAGGAFWEQRQRFDQHSEQVMQRFEEQSIQLQALTNQQASYAGVSAAKSIPDADASSLNKLVDAQLDGIKQLLVSGKFDDALTALSTLGSNVDALDEHQKARWYTQRAHCYWHQSEFGLAAGDFATAYALTPNEDKAISNHATGQLLVGNVDEALAIVTDAKARFPASTSLYTVWMQVISRQGQTIEYPHDVPPEMRRDADVLTVLGWIAASSGRHQEAATLAKLAINGGSDGYPQTSLRLLALVNQAAENGVLASLTLIPGELKAELEDAISGFRPFDTKVWQRQDQATTGQTVACLGYALLMTACANEAVELLREGVRRFSQDGQIARVYLESLRRIGPGIDKPLEFGRSCIEILDREARLTVAEMAAKRADFETLEQIRKSFGDDTDDELRDELRAFEWLARASSGKGKELASELSRESVNSMRSIAAKVVALNVAIATDMPWVTQAIDEMAAVIHASSPIGEVLMVAQACFAVDMYDKTVSLLKGRLPVKGMSEPHKMLFEALIKTGARKKALQMLEAFPASAMDDADVRGLAVDLAQAANDWKQLLKLSELQLLAHDNRAEAWAFRAAVLYRQQNKADLRALLNRAIPLNLKGSIPAHTQLARFDIELGDRRRGLARLYRLFRSALTDAKAASAYLTNILLLNPGAVPLKPVRVGEGTAITLVNAKGESRIIVVDPDGLDNMPPAAQFINTASQVYGAFSGRQLGDTVVMSNGLGFEDEYRVSNLDSAYRYLAGRADAVNREAVGQNTSMFSIHTPVKDDGGMDFSEILKVLTARSARASEVFDMYANGPTTLGMVGKLLGVNPMVVAGDWPAAPHPKLYVCHGTVEERSAAEALLTPRPKAVVIDLTALSELVAHGLQTTLKLAERVYISTSAVETLDELIHGAQSERARGHMRAENGRISLVEYDADYHQDRLGYLRRLRECIDRYCEVVPAWGNEELPEHFPEIGPHLGDESYDALLLCLERNALLLTLDGRLRELGKALGSINGVWPQVFCHAALAQGLCSNDVYRGFVISSIQRRRTHTALSPHEYLWVFSRPAALRQSSTDTIARYVSEPSIELKSIASVILEVAQRLLVSGTTHAGICQFLYRATMPLFARSEVNADSLERWFTGTLCGFLRTNFTKRTANQYEREASQERQEPWIQAIEVGVRAAKQVGPGMTMSDLAAVSLGVVSLYVSLEPFFIAAGLDDSHDPALTLEQR